MIYFLNLPLGFFKHRGGGEELRYEGLESPRVLHRRKGVAVVFVDYDSYAVLSDILILRFPFWRSCYSEDVEKFPPSFLSKQKRGGGRGKVNTCSLM